MMNKLQEFYEKSRFYATLFVVICPIFYLLLSLFLDSRYDLFFIYFAVAVCFIILVPFRFILGKPKLNKLNPKNYNTISILPIILLLLAFLWAGISVFFAKNVEFALFDCYSGRAEGFIMYILYAIIIMTAFGVKKEDYKKIILYTFVGISTFIGIVGLLNDFNIIKTFAIDYCGAFQNQNHYGYFLTIAIILSAGLFCFDDKKFIKIYALINFIFQNIILFLNDTLGSEIAVFVMIIFVSIVVLLKDKKKWKSVLIIDILYIFTIFADYLLKNVGFLQISFIEDVKELFVSVKNMSLDPSDSVSSAVGTNRWGLWLETFKNMKEFPIFGIGINCQLVVNPNLESSRPHNEILQFGSTMGIPMMIFYVLTFIILLIIMIKQRKKMGVYSYICFMGMFAYLVSSFFGVSLPYTYSLFCVFIGLSLSGIDYSKKIKKTE